MRLTKGKKLVVYFGYLEEANEDNSKRQETSEPKSQVELFADHSEEVVAQRNRLLDKFIKNRDVQDVSDLFAKPPTHIIYNPIFFKIHLPISLQRSCYGRSDSENALSEDFECVYAGGLLFISAICDFSKEPFGVFDVRDRIITILETVMKIKLVPPTLFGRPFVFALKEDTETPKLKEDEVLYELVEDDDSKNLLRELYEMVGFELEAFYEFCADSYELFYKVEKIEDKILKLLDAVSGSPQKSWKSRLGADTADRRKDIIEILAEVSEYLSQDSERIRSIRDFEMLCNSSPISPTFKPEDIRFYGEPDVKLDREFVFKSLEFARSELDSRLRNRFALLSAFTGAIVGSVVTLLLSHALA